MECWQKNRIKLLPPLLSLDLYRACHYSIIPDMKVVLQLSGLSVSQAQQEGVGLVLGRGGSLSPPSLLAWQTSWPWVPPQQSSHSGILLPQDYSVAGDGIYSSAYAYSHTNDWAWSTSSKMDTCSNIQEAQIMKLSLQQEPALSERPVMLSGHGLRVPLLPAFWEVDQG